MNPRCAFVAMLLAGDGAAFGQQPAALSGRVYPMAAAGIQMTADHRLEPVTAWRTLGGPPRDPAAVAVFDAFGADPATGVPTGFCSSGCAQFGWCPGAPESQRWWGGPNFRNPFATNDMTVAPGFGGTDAVRVQFAWWWQHPAPARCFVAVLTGSSFTDCSGSTPPVSGDLGGIIFDFGALSGGDGYLYADVDARSIGQSWRMPANGSGSYSIMLGADYNATTGAFTVDTTLGTQPMQWGNGDRAGTQGPMEWDDWRNADGVLQWNECSYYSDIHCCPLPMGAMLAFFAAAAPCYANCDHSTGAPALNVLDFACFLNEFAAGDAAANCDGSTAPPVLNVNDFACFLNAFAAGCP